MATTTAQTSPGDDFGTPLEEMRGESESFGAESPAGNDFPEDTGGDDFEDAQEDFGDDGDEDELAAEITEYDDTMVKGLMDEEEEEPAESFAGSSMAPSADPRPESQKSPDDGNTITVECLVEQNHDLDVDGNILKEIHVVRENEDESGTVTSVLTFTRNVGTKTHQVEEIRENDEIKQFLENTNMPDAETVDEFDNQWTQDWRPRLLDDFDFHDEFEFATCFLCELEAEGARNNSSRLPWFQGLSLTSTKVKGGCFDLLKTDGTRDSAIPIIVEQEPPEPSDGDFGGDMDQTAQTGQSTFEDAQEEQMGGDETANGGWDDAGGVGEGSYIDSQSRTTGQATDFDGTTADDGATEFDGATADGTATGWDEGGGMESGWNETGATAEDEFDDANGSFQEGGTGTSSPKY